MHPIVGAATTATHQGAWLTAADGGVFSFGDAHYWGSAVGRLATGTTAIGIQPSSTGAGYAIVAADGSIYDYGDAVTPPGPDPVGPVHLVAAAGTADHLLTTTANGTMTGRATAAFDW